MQNDHGLMREFNLLCKEVEDLDPLTYSDVLRAKSAKLITALAIINRDGITGVQIFSSFVIQAIMADGKLDKAEYELIRPGLEAFVGEEISYEDAKAAFKAVKKDIKEDRYVVDLMVDILGELSEELKEDVVIVTMLICAADGKISMREKNWIKQLIE